MIKLSKFTEPDFDRFIAWIPDERFMYQFAGPVFSFPVTIEQLRTYISEPFRQIYKVIDAETEEVIGHAELNNINTQNNSARICRVLIANAKSRNKGYGQQLIEELLRIGFNDLSLHRIDLGVFKQNKQAIKSYEKCGFQKEGLFRDSFRIQGEYYSTYNMSILRHEWESRG